MPEPRPISAEIRDHDTVSRAWLTYVAYGKELDGGLLGHGPAPLKLILHAR
jgi:hypothetical protein